MNAKLLVALAVLSAWAAPGAAKPAPNGWALKRVLTETSPDGDKSVVESKVLADETGALRTTNDDGSWYQRRWADGHELVGDPAAKTWHELDPAGQVEARGAGQGFLLGLLGAKQADIRVGEIEATGESREFEGIECPRVLIRDAPLQGLTTSVFHCEGLVSDSWKERLLAAELGGSNTPPVLPYELIATLPGYPVLIEIDVEMGPLRRNLRYELQQLQAAKVKPAQAALPAKWKSGKSAWEKLDESLTKASQAYNRAPIPGSKGLYLAAQKGDVDAIRRLAAGGASLEAPGPEGRSALQLAAMKEQPESVKVLVELGASLEAAPGPRARTALHLAAKEGCVASIRALLVAGAAPNARDSEEKTPLHLAAWRNNKADAALALLEDERVDKDAKDSWDRTPLLLAASRGMTNPVRALLAAGADPSIKNKTGNNPLSIAKRNERSGVVAVLESAGAPDVPRDLFWAARNGDAGLAAELLAAGADPNVVGDNGFSPLGECLRNNRLEAVKALVEGGADLDFRQENGYSVFQQAASWDSEEAFDLFLSLGANVNSTTDKGLTALHLAAGQGNLGILGKLLANPAVDRGLGYTKSGRTALHQAAYTGRLEAVRALVTVGMPANLSNETGFQPVHSAASGGSREVVEFLLAQPEVQADAADKWSCGLLWYAVRSGHGNLIPFLIEQGASLELQDWKGRSLAQVAIDEGHPELVPLLQQ